MIFRRRLWNRIRMGGLGILILISAISLIWNYSSIENKPVNQININSEEKKTLQGSVSSSVSSKDPKDITIASAPKNSTDNGDKEEEHFRLPKDDSALFFTPAKHHDNYLPEAEENTILKASVQEPMNICENVVISILGKATETCQDKQEGTLELSIRGGTSPYKYDLYETGSRETVSYSKDNALFSQLEAGRYKVIVTDKNGCKGKSEELVVTEKKCREESMEEYSFKPEYNEQFKFLAEEAGIIVIYDRSGKEQWNGQLRIDEELVWEGTNSNGRLVEKGIYLFVVTYKTGISKKGYITVY